MEHHPSQDPLVVPAEAQEDPEKQKPPPEAAYPPQQQEYPQQPAAYPPQQPPAYPPQQGYGQQPPPAYQGYPQGGYPLQGYPPQTTTVIATQPTNTTTYVQPSSRRDSETIPTAGLIFTIIHIFVCLSFGNLAIFVCLIPALICAIVGLGNNDNEQSAKTCGWLAIGTNIATIFFYMAFLIALAIGLAVGLPRNTRF